LSTPAGRALGGEDIAALFKSRNRRRSAHFALFWRDSAHSRLGLVVSKKLAGNAIRRNLVKRHAREAFRHWRAEREASAGARDMLVRVVADVRALDRSEQFAEIRELFGAVGV
jgi:ribonuclease P protein component